MDTVTHSRFTPVMNSCPSEQNAQALDSLVNITPEDAYTCLEIVIKLLNAEGALYPGDRIGLSLLLTFITAHLPH